MPLILERHRTRPALEEELRNLAQLIRRADTRIARLESNVTAVENIRTPTSDFVQEAVLPAYYTGTQ